MSVSSVWYAFALSYLTIDNLSDERDIIIQVVHEVKEDKWRQRQQPQHAFLSRIYKKKPNQKGRPEHGSKAVNQRAETGTGAAREF